MKHTLASLMKPAMGMSVRELNGGTYIFQFYDAVDLNRIMDMSPWSFNNQALLLERMGEYGNPWDVPLNHIYLWIKIFGLRSGFRSESVVKYVGDDIGEFVEADPTNYIDKWKEHWCVRVKLDINKPLKSSLTLKKEKTKETITVTFAYERLPTFCFLCGVLGHGEKFCPLLVKAKGAKVNRRFGPQLRDGGGRFQGHIGAKWLREEPGFGESSAADGGEHGGDTPVVEKGKSKFYGINPLFMQSIPVDLGYNGGGNNAKQMEGNNMGRDKSKEDNNDGDTDSISINDPKRRRTGPGEHYEAGKEGGPMDTNEVVINDTTQSERPNASKNGGKAGLGDQSRGKNELP
ncbi:hypothetical protein K2173_020472 [Erythroxylum novogranatense]|uniref:CCHC-type domain-containing protein n=1 Tax=Erythroxylum novogranatense TaxID=1862640 RepID=A0AAV8TGE7_9ROSI|nr:hypothetical protein K2173_020472 [Erythroxylum novogranatense]